MGNWQMEVVKMMLYVTFPVGVFHYFNQPQNFEEQVINAKKASFPVQSKKQREELANFIEECNRRTELERLQEMEQQYHMQEKQASS